MWNCERGQLKHVQCCPKYVTQKLWRKPVFLSGMNGSEWVKRNSHPSLLHRNIDKVTLTCVFKRSDLTVITFFLHHDNSTAHWRYTGTQFVAKEIYCLTRTSTLFARFCYFQKRNPTWRDKFAGQYRCSEKGDDIAEGNQEKEFCNFFQQWQRHWVVV